jgi:hypothetical protein
MSNGSYYSNGRHAWSDQTLWDAAEQEPVTHVRILSLPEAPELRTLADDYLRVTDCDTKFPIIITPEGHLADGYHRCVERLLQGHETVLARRLRNMPEPDRPHDDRWLIDDETGTVTVPGGLLSLKFDGETLQVLRDAQDRLPPDGASILP